jgi:hypothetical protein
MELWKEVDWIDGYRGVMEVSNHGRIRRKSYKYEATGRWGTLHTTTKPDKLLAPYTEKNGYPSVAVQIDGKRRKFSVHRLVGRAFVSGYSPELTINHINGVKTDNRAENLEWVTLARNTQHQWEIGLVDLRGDANPNRKLSSGQVRIMRRLLKIGATAGELATLSGVSASTVYLIEKGERWNSI